MALPQILKLRFTAQDSSLMTLGLGNVKDMANWSAPTRCLTQYELFYPRGTYYRDSPNLGMSSTPGLSGSAYPYPGFNSPTFSPETIVDVFPGQMSAFIQLYKLARVERVDFSFKITNMGPSSITDGGNNPPTASNQAAASGPVNHTILVLPQSQVTDTFQTATNKWNPSSIHSDSNACQLAELPGCTSMTSSQDGNKEVIRIRKSFDLTMRQGGDSIRTATWMTSTDLPAAPAWTIPAAQPTDPILLSIGTSPLIDQTLSGMFTGSGTTQDFWLRYNEHIQVTYHVTFWDPRTPTIVFV